VRSAYERWFDMPAGQCACCTNGLGRSHSQPLKGPGQKADPTHSDVAEVRPFNRWCLSLQPVMFAGLGGRPNGVLGGVTRWRERWQLLSAWSWWIARGWCGGAWEC